MNVERLVNIGSQSFCWRVDYPILRLKIIPNRFQVENLFTSFVFNVELILFSIVFVIFINIASTSPNTFIYSSQSLQESLIFSAKRAKRQSFCGAHINWHLILISSFNENILLFFSNKFVLISSACLLRQRMKQNTRFCTLSRWRKTIYLTLLL